MADGCSRICKHPLQGSTCPFDTKGAHTPKESREDQITADQTRPTTQTRQKLQSTSVKTMQYKSESRTSCRQTTEDQTGLDQTRPDQTNYTDKTEISVNLSQNNAVQVTCCRIPANRNEYSTTLIASHMASSATRKKEMPLDSSQRWKSTVNRVFLNLLLFCFEMWINSQIILKSMLQLNKNA